MGTQQRRRDDDHPNEKRYSDRIETITVEWVFARMTRSGLGNAPVTVHGDAR